MIDSSEKGRCPICGEPVGERRSRCPKCGRILPRGRNVLILAVAAMVVVAVIGVAMLSSTPSINEQGANLTNRTIGSGNVNFWTTYPASHPNAGTSFSHPIWVLQALQDGPVMIFAHTLGCDLCAEQITIC